MPVKNKKKPIRRAAAQPSRSTALVRLQRDVGKVLKSVELIEPQAHGPSELTRADMRLTDDTQIGDLGLVEVKLTEKEETALARAVNVGDVLIKPTGQPYLSHPAYTRWFNEAFGRLGWALVPRGKPQRAGNSVCCAYVLYIHGQPAAFAIGEQEYFENNKEQTFGDAVEATVASALRRCAKRLGVGLELWDKRFLNAFIAKECVKVFVEGENKPRWRRRDEPPFWNERGKVHGDEQRTKQESRDVHAPPQERRPPLPAHDGTADVMISDAQRKRLWVIIQKSGRTEDDVRSWLLERYRISSTREIPRRLYDDICKAVEAKGGLPTREPGEDE